MLPPGMLSPPGFGSLPPAVYPSSFRPPPGLAPPPGLTHPFLDADDADEADSSNDGVMIQNIPREMTCQDMADLLAELGLADICTGITIPRGSKRAPSNRGYAFVSVVASNSLGLFTEAFESILVGGREQKVLPWTRSPRRNGEEEGRQEKQTIDWQTHYQFVARL